MNFIIEYIKAYKAVGAHGVIMAEPLAGILSPQLCQEFSTKYVKEIVKLRKLDPDELDEQDELMVMYRRAAGL